MTVQAHRPRCYLDIEIDHEPVGRIIIELFADVCPLTCENFRSLCCGDKGYGKTTKKPLSYKGTLFHRVINKFVIQSGDFESGNGTGGESIYGGQFNDENFLIKHDKPFLLSMANKGRNTNGSQFFILTKPSPHLDGKHVVFGQVISGFEVVSEIENLEVYGNNRPIKEVKIAQCGELVLKSDKKRQRKTSSDSSSEDEEEDKRKKKKKKSKKNSKKHKKEKKISKNRSGNKEEDDIPCSVDPEEIPSVPANNFLMRRTSPAAEFRRAPRESYNYKRRPPSRSRSGRKIKGRGNMRYRTPDSSERSGSETPPHWKQAQSRLKNIKDIIPLKSKDKDNPSDEMSGDDDHEDGNVRNPFLQSRLGMVFKNSTNFRKDRDARWSIDENRRRWSPEESAHCSYRNTDSRNTDSRKADLFKQLFEENARHENQWFQPRKIHSPEKRNDNLTSPLRSKIVVKSNAASRNSRERESRNVERLYRVHEENNRRSSFADRRSHNFRFDASSSEQGNFYRSDDKHREIENKKEKNKNSDVTKYEKKEISNKAQKRFNLLENDLFRYTKHEPPKRKETEPETEKPHSDVAVNDSLPQENVLNNIHLDSLSTIENFHNVKSPEKLEASKSNNTTPAVSESPKLEESFEESVVNKAEKIIAELSVLKNDDEYDFHSEEPNQNNVSLLQNIVEYTTAKDSDNENINDTSNSDYNQSDHLSIPVPEEPSATRYDSNRKINSPPLVEHPMDDESSTLQKQSLPDIIPLPDERNKAHTIALEEKHLEVESHEDRENICGTDELDGKQEDVNKPTPVSLHHNKHGSREKSSSSSSSEHNLNLKPRPLVQSRSPIGSRSPSQEPQISAPKNRRRSKSPAHHSTRKKQTLRSPSDRHRSPPSRRSRSPVTRRSRSPSHKNKSPVSRRNRSSNSRRSRSRSAHRSTSKNSGRRRFSRSPVTHQKRSRSPPRNSGRGLRSFRYSGVRNRSPDRRGAFQRRYGNSPVNRGQARGRSASRRSDSRSRSRSVDKRRRRRRQSTSSSSSSSSSSRSETVKKRIAKNSAKRGKRASSSSTASSRSKRSNSDSN